MADIEKVRERVFSNFKYPMSFDEKTTPHTVYGSGYAICTALMAILEELNKIRIAVEARKI